MASKTFTLGEENHGICVKILLVILTLGVVTTAVIVGYYVFKSKIDAEFYGCKAPDLDPNGLSNWTAGAEVVALACFGDHTIQSDKIAISHCVNNEWIPEPPTCVALPIHLICRVDKNGIQGTLHMWQIRKEDPLQIYGNLSTLNIDRTKGLLSEEILLSRNTCSSSEDFNISLPAHNLSSTSPHPEDFIEVIFKTQSLVAYKKAELRVVMIFIDAEKTATIVSVTQNGITVVMPKPYMDPSSWEFSDSEDKTTAGSLGGSGNGKEIDTTPKFDPDTSISSRA